MNTGFVQINVRHVGVRSKRRGEGTTLTSSRKRGVNEGQHIAMRSACSGVSNPCNVVNGLVDDSCSEGEGDLPGAISARIVDNDQLHCATTNRDGIAKAGSGCRKIGLLIERGDDDADQHTVSAASSVTCGLELEGLADAEEGAAQWFAGAAVELDAVIETEQEVRRADADAETGGLAQLPGPEV